MISNLPMLLALSVKTQDLSAETAVLILALLALCAWGQSHAIDNMNCFSWSIDDCAALPITMLGRSGPDDRLTSIKLKPTVSANSPTHVRYGLRSQVHPS